MVKNLVLPVTMHRNSNQTKTRTQAQPEIQRFYHFFTQPPNRCRIIVILSFHKTTILANLHSICCVTCGCSSLLVTLEEHTIQIALNVPYYYRVVLLPNRLLMRW